MSVLSHRGSEKAALVFEGLRGLGFGVWHEAQIATNVRGRLMHFFTVGAVAADVGVCQHQADSYGDCQQSS